MLRALLSDRAVPIAVVVVLAAALALGLANQAGQVPNWVIPLVGKYLCFALLAISIDLVWGYGGILSLGHGVFFGLGGYAIGMHMMRLIGPRGVYANPILPDFMVFLNWTELPGTGTGSSISPSQPRWRCWCPGSWLWCSAGLPSAAASQASISPSSPRR